MLISALVIQQYHDLVEMLIPGGLMKRTQAKIILFLLRKNIAIASPVQFTSEKE